MLQIGQVLDPKSGPLSGAQGQQVAIGRELFLGPGDLLLDEPLSYLTEKMHVVMRTEIRKLHQRLGSAAFGSGQTSGRKRADVDVRASEVSDSSLDMDKAVVFDPKSEKLIR